MLAEASATKNLEASVKVAMRVLSFVIGLAAVALAAVDVVRTINPSLLTGHSGFFGLVFNFYPVVPALVTGLVGFAFSFVLKILSRGSRRSKLTSWALVLSLIGVLLSGASYATTHIFPEGMIHPVNTSSAPLNDSDELTERMNWAFNPCDSGWAVIDPARFPGVSYINVCASTSVLLSRTIRASRRGLTTGLCPGARPTTSKRHWASRLTRLISRRFPVTSGSWSGPKPASSGCTRFGVATLSPLPPPSPALGTKRSRT